MSESPSRGGPNVSPQFMFLQKKKKKKIIMIIIKDCGYMSEPRRRGGPNESPQFMFWPKIGIYHCNPSHILSRKPAGQ